MTASANSPQQLAAQPIGYWAPQTAHLIIGGLRTALAEEHLTQPHWWTNRPGETGRLRAHARNAKVHAATRQGIDDTAYAATIDTLRRMVATSAATAIAVTPYWPLTTDAHGGPTG
ncbi:hypothetical protein ACWGIU_18670 [Streptomyces sp. NPDC054840]